MSKFILPFIFIGIAIALFFTFTNPLYKDVSDFRANVSSYNEALSNSKALENERDKLTQKYNAISPDNLDRLQKLLPENVDNIRLILEIEKIASPYGMVLRDVKYNTNGGNNTIPATGGIVAAGSTSEALPKDYGTWDLEFSTMGTYANFLNFIRDLESNLRIVDISSIDFSSDVALAPGLPPSSALVYKYNFKIKTYWLKN